MAVERSWRRIGRWIAALGRGLRYLVRLVAGVLGFRQEVALHTLVTYRAVVDAVIPETPELGDELGPEHVPGGLAIGLEEFLATYIDDGFQLGLPYVGPQGNVPLAEPVAQVLDVAALKLLERDETVSEPDVGRALSLLEPDEASPTSVERAAGPFSKLTREDRLRAIGILDEVEFEVTPFEDELFEFDAGLVGQLVIGFGEMIYYSEWQGYEDFLRPPSERTHPNDSAAVQSWRQTGYPGFEPGYAALRGYLGTDDSSLGDGEVWKTLDEDASSPVRITHESGTFRENEYDTSDYEEPFPE